MNDIRARFEEIWPVPAGVYWHEGHSCYLPMEDQWDYCDLLVSEWNDRLDTFTRCQETTDVYVSLIGEMVVDIEYLIEFAAGNEPYSTAGTLKLAKQIMEQKK